MGHKWSQLISRFFGRGEPAIRVGMLGLDNAGKTTILYQLKTHVNVQPQPTVGFNVETVKCGRILLNIWDISGSEPRTRLIWQHYNQQKTKAIIFVIDCADLERIPIAAAELRWLWFLPELSEAVFLIFANKQDLNGALSADQLMLRLGLRSFPNWSIQECCALNGMGLWDGVQQMEQMLLQRRNYNSLLKKLQSKNK